MEEAPEETRRRRSREASARWYLKNAEKERARCARWKTENPAKRLLGKSRIRAKARGLEFALTLADIEAMMAPMVCSVTGLPLSLEHESNSKANPWAPSIDRIDNSKGYVPSNVRLVCAIYNLARADWPDEAFLTLVRALRPSTST